MVVYFVIMCFFNGARSVQKRLFSYENTKENTKYENTKGDV